MSEEIETPTEGAIRVKITLDSRPEFKRRPYDKTAQQIKSQQSTTVISGSSGSYLRRPIILCSNHIVEKE